MFTCSFGVAIPLLLFFMKAVQDERGVLELHGIDRAIRAPSVILDDLQDPGAAEALERLRRAMLHTPLREIQRMTENFRTPTGSAAKSLFLLPIQMSGFSLLVTIGLYQKWNSWQRTAPGPESPIVRRKADLAGDNEHLM